MGFESATRESFDSRAILTSKLKPLRKFCVQIVGQQLVAGLLLCGWRLRKDTYRAQNQNS
jgi:hypothetical protein